MINMSQAEFFDDLGQLHELTEEMIDAARMIYKASGNSYDAAVVSMYNSAVDNLTVHDVRLITQVLLLRLAGIKPDAK